MKAVSIIVGALAAVPAMADERYWSQCGGDGYTGDTSCPSGWYCQSHSQFYSDCMPDSIGDKKRAVVDKRDRFWAQCGGDSSYTGPTDCPADWYCKHLADEYDECWPNDLTKRDTFEKRDRSWAQCGGDATYTGPTDCPANFYCKHLADEYDECWPDWLDKREEKVEKRGSQAWEQCGGDASYTGPTDCPANFYCKHLADEYDECWPNWLTKRGVDNQKRDRYWAQCGGDSTYTGPTDCPADWYCKHLADEYDECWPNDLS